MKLVLRDTDCPDGVAVLCLSDYPRGFESERSFAIAQPADLVLKVSLVHFFTI